MKLISKTILIKTFMLLFLLEFIQCLHIWIFQKCLPCPWKVCSYWSNFTCVNDFLSLKEMCRTTKFHRLWRDNSTWKTGFEAPPWVPRAKVHRMETNEVGPVVQSVYKISPLCCSILLKILSVETPTSQAAWLLYVCAAAWHVDWLVTMEWVTDVGLWEKLSQEAPCFIQRHHSQGADSSWKRNRVKMSFTWSSNACAKTKY